MRFKRLLAVLVLWSSGATMLSAQTESEVRLKTLASDMEKRFPNCPRREVVARFDRKHHKQVWQKEAWGPPTDVFADAKPNDSVLYPYVISVEFSLRMSFGPERESKVEAENDSTLSPLPYMPKAKYRNVFLVGKDEVRLKSREVLSQKLDGSSGTWEERPSWPDACWDQIVGN
jgi:hypothetical protein